jgi:hypothetical protein
MVYVVQNYLGFLDSVHRLVCGSFTKDHNVSETGSISVLRWMGQGRPTQLGPSERASLNHWTHPPEDGDRSSLRNVVVFCKTSTTRRWTESKRSQIVLYCPYSFSIVVCLFCNNLYSLCVVCLHCLCSFVCCVLFECGVLFCAVCYLCVVSYCSTTATG